MTKDEEVMQAIFAERGYLVIRSREDYRPGHVLDKSRLRINTADGRCLATEQCFYVIRETDRTDLDGQYAVIRKLGWEPYDQGPENRYYRVGTD
jgi:hypothetical protein